MTGRDRGQAGHALPARGKGVAQFAGHGDCVTIGGTELGAKRVERGLEAVEPEPQWRCGLKHRFDAALAHPRRLQMRAPDIPADDDAHASSELCSADA